MEILTIDMFALGHRYLIDIAGFFRTDQLKG
jgi:hypothetical protein